MKKVLLVGRYYGTRIPGLLKYLPEFGWQPVLLTTTLPEDVRLPADIPVIEVPYQNSLQFLRRLLGKDIDTVSGSRTEGNSGFPFSRAVLDWIIRWGAEVVDYPEYYKNWKSPAVRAGDELLRREKINVILSSSPPLTGHLIARELKVRHRIPWIADLRDLWSQNHNYYYSPIRRLFDRRLELKTLSTADALVTVSRPWSDKLGRFHGRKIVYTITNGFDAEVVSTTPEKLTSGFTITYTGYIYRGKQHPGRLFVALRRLINDGLIDPADVEVRFYGPRLDWLKKEIAGYSLSGVVRQYGSVSRSAAIARQKESLLLLLLDWDDPAEKGCYPMKAFEYMGAGRPILATGGVAGNVIDRLLEDTKAGVHAVTADSIEASLIEFYQEYKKKGEISYHGLEAEIGKYTHREMTGKFAAILDHVTKQ